MTAKRRTKYALLTGALLATITGVCGLAVALGDQFSTRLDATATRDHSLDERTERLIDALDAEHELVISADLAPLAPAARGALADLIDALDRTDNLRVSVIDSREALADLLERLAERDAGVIDAHASAIETASTEVQEAANGALRLAERLLAFDADDASVRANIEAGAASLQNVAAELKELEPLFTELRERSFAGVALPEADSALAALDDPGSRLALSLNTLDIGLDAIRRTAAASDDAESSRWASSALELSERTRSALRRADDALRALGPLEVLRVARVIEQREIIMLVGPERTTGIGVRTLVPDTNTTGAEAIRRVREGQQALATALATAAIEHPPIVVLVHAAQQRLLDNSGQPLAPLEPAFGALAARLRQRSITLAEWAVSAGQAMPTRASLDPTGQRPIVWMTAGVPAPGSRDRYRRLADFGAGLSRLAENGESLLLTLAPSDALSLGEVDPLASVAGRFGLYARTDAPLITATEGGVFLTQDVRTVVPDTALSASVEGLPVLLAMPSPIDVLEVSKVGVETSPLMTVASTEETWGESEWFGLVYARGVTPPTPTRDVRGDAIDGPFTVVASASRARPEGEASPTIDGAQRVVVVTGSDEWYSTNVLTTEQEVDGVRSLRFPGNAALLDASISYLAGLDELLAREARSADVARIRAMSDRELLLLRLALIVGLPLHVLVAWGAWRLLRR